MEILLDIAISTSPRGVLLACVRDGLSADVVVLEAERDKWRKPGLTLCQFVVLLGISVVQLFCLL